MTTDLKLEELARAATPGPWERGNGPYILGPSTRGSGLMDICTISINSTERNAAFIAACSPELILSLLSRLKVTDELHDSAYIAGMKVGWNLGIVEDTDKFQSIVEGRLKQKRDAITALPKPRS